MKKLLLSIMMLSGFTMFSCVTSKDVIPAISGESTSSIKVPTGFVWQNSRDLNFTVNVSDTKFQTAIHLISIYNGDPTTGASLLAKGSATILTAFRSRIFASNKTTEVYVVKTSPDKSKTTQKVQLGTSDIVTTIGI